MGDALDFNLLATKTQIHDAKHKSLTVNCAHATPEEHGCDAMTSLCLYEDVHHTEWAQSMPQLKEVMVFFIKSLCLQQGAMFNEVMMNCECADDSLFDGLYCITPKKALGENASIRVKNSEKESVAEKPMAMSERETAENVENKSEIDKELDDNLKSAKWKEIVRNGRKRNKHKRHSDMLSVLGKERNRYKNGFDLFNGVYCNWTVHNVHEEASWLSIFKSQ